jgi:hypothetical protein
MSTRTELAAYLFTLVVVGFTGVTSNTDLFTTVALTLGVLVHLFLWVFAIVRMRHIFA